MEYLKENFGIANLKNFIKQHRNEDFKFSVSSEGRPEIISITGNCLIHTAVTENNISIIAFLFSSGFDINAQNTLGQTPLFVAVSYSCFKAAQLLLSLEANILISDYEGFSPLKLCFQENKKVPEYIINCFLESLKRVGLSSEQMADHLQKAGCSIKQALAINNAEVTGQLLDRKTLITKYESHDLIERALSLDYPDNVRILVERGPQSNVRLNIFTNKVIDQRSDSKMKLYLDRLFEWDLVTENFIRRASLAFTTASEKEIKKYLDIGIDEYAKKKFGWELLVGLFATDEIDFVSITKNRNFNVDGTDMGGYTALHVATIFDNRKAVAYLLNIGADPNIKDNEGKTPLFYCNENDVSRPVLLNADVDLLIVDNNGKTIFDDIHIIDNLTMVKLAILSSKSLLKKDLRERIERDNDEFSYYVKDLEHMKSLKMTDSLTLFSLIVDDVVNIARHIKSKSIVNDMLTIAIKKYSLSMNFRDILTRNLEKALEINELRHKAAVFLCKMMRIGPYDHLVIENIIKFLTYRDLLRVCKV